ncbi:MAG TPA: hypothetical protein PK595_09065 [Bacteroidota bacterium]|nr:hypothetical protein [Bacteroidota bacterium]
MSTEETVDEFMLDEGEYIPFFELNQNLDEQSFYLTEVENAIDSLETAVAFLFRDDNLKWKWIGIALHHSLYSFCIACLVNGNYENVLSVGRDDDNNLFCLQGNDTKWMKSKRKKRPKSGGYTIEWSYTDEDPTATSNPKPLKERKENLIGFWTALARVQDQTYWMGRGVRTKALTLNEDEWQSIEWLTSQVRNGCVHFVPKALAVSIPSVKKASLATLRAIEFLALHSYAIVYMEHEESHKRIEDAIKVFRSKVSL